MHSACKGMQFDPIDWKFDCWLNSNKSMSAIYTWGTYLQTLYHVDNTLILGLFSEQVIHVVVSIK